MNATRRALLVLILLLAGTAASAAEFRGNKESRVFHQSSCRHFACRNCTVVFASAEEAVRRGFRPCGICRPAASRSADRAVSVGDGYSANTSSRKFHRASCRYASCSHCTAKFKTRQAAIDAGFVPGGCCKP